ncbi:MAG: YciI family protein [Candidatus Kariarchaeaceae archaeon]|jgi:uncharacterized protein YciI
MNQIFIVRLTPNQVKIQSNMEEKQKLGKGHHDYIESLVEQKVIQFGGPIEGKPGGMLIVNGSSKEAVEKIFGEDPLIKQEYLLAKVNKWTIKHGSFPKY